MGLVGSKLAATHPVELGGGKAVSNGDLQEVLEQYAAVLSCELGELKGFEACGSCGATSILVMKYCCCAMVVTHHPVQ